VESWEFMKWRMKKWSLIPKRILGCADGQIRVPTGSILSGTAASGDENNRINIIRICGIRIIIIRIPQLEYIYG
jgi:hypothetical protein